MPQCPSPWSAYAWQRGWGSPTQLLVERVCLWCRHPSHCLCSPCFYLWSLAALYYSGDWTENITMMLTHDWCLYKMQIDKLVLCFPAVFILLCSRGFHYVQGQVTYRIIKTDLVWVHSVWENWWQYVLIGSTLGKKGINNKKLIHKKEPKRSLAYNDLPIIFDPDESG